MKILLYKHAQRKKAKHTDRTSVWWPLDVGYVPEEVANREAFMSWVQQKFGMGEYMVKIPPEQERRHRGLMTILKFKWKPRHPRPFVSVDHWKRYIEGTDF